MFEIESIVRAFIFLLGSACIFGLLFWLVGYLERKFPGEGPNMIWMALRIFLAVAMVMVLIGFILHVMGHPLVRW